MIGNSSTGTPSTQAYLNYSYQYQSAKLLVTSGPAATGGVGAGGGRKQAHDCECDPTDPSIDSVDLRNSRGLQPSAETVLSMIEEKVNGRVEASFSTEETQPREEADYWSAEKTGERIARFALKFYDRYAERNGGESEKNLEGFLKLIGGAIDEGFGQATTQIAETSGGEMPSDKKSLVDATHDRVFSILEEFRKTVMERLRANTTQEGATEASNAIAPPDPAQPEYAQAI